MEPEEDYFGISLQKPVAISDLLKTGARFEIDANFDYDDLNDDYPDIAAGDDSAFIEEKENEILSPWEQSFDKLRLQMKPLDGDEKIYKRIIKDSYGDACPKNARVSVHYNAFFEKETQPFDSTYLRGEPKRFETGQAQVLIGIEKAVATMRQGEESQFVISYEYLFGSMGCPPRIKPNADALFVIKVLQFIEVGDENAASQLSESDRRKYSIVLEKVKDIHKRAKDQFKQGNLSSATNNFQKAIGILDYCNLANEQEQLEQQEFILKLQTNLAVCYNKMNLPKKACIACNEVERLTDCSRNTKILFQKGRALLMIGEYKLAKSYLTRAQAIEPQNKDIINELKLLNEKHKTHSTIEKSIWTKAFGVIKESETIEKRTKNEFKNNLINCLNEFKTNETEHKLTLPDRLTEDEISCINELTKEMSMKLSISNMFDKKSYTIYKNPKK